MDKNSKIIGFYSYTDYVGKDNEPKKVYVYVSKDKETGKLSYQMTNEDSDEYKEAFVKYCKDNGYNKKNQDRIFTDNKFKANINCKSPEHVFSLIKKANKNVEVDEEEYNDIVDDYYKETTKRNILNKIKGFKELPKKGLYFIKSHPKVTVAAACLALIVGGGIFKLATNKGPTANNSRIATTVDNNKDNIDKNNINNKTNEENKEETQKDTSSQATTTETTTNETYTATPTTYRNSGNSSSSNSSNGNTGSGSTNGSSNSGSSVTDSNLPEFQDPNASIDDSNDQNTGNENTDEDDKYDNVIEEDPGNSNTNTDDSNNDTSDTIEEEVPVEDEDYSEEIDVPAISDDNENSNDTNNGDTSTDIKEEDEDLTTGNIDLDPSIPESAIDSDLSYEYEESYDNESGNIDEIINAEPLPDPNETATGDYVTDENEWYFANDNSNTTTQSNDTATEDVDVVPVEQATTTTTTTTSNYDSNVAAVDQVIEAMANGNANVNLVYNQDGSLSVGYTETTPTAQAEAEASSMTK